MDGRQTSLPSIDACGRTMTQWPLVILSYGFHRIPSKKQLRQPWSNTPQRLSLLNGYHKIICATTSYLWYRLIFNKATRSLVSLVQSYSRKAVHSSTQLRRVLSSFTVVGGFRLRIKVSSYNLHMILHKQACLRGTQNEDLSQIFILSFSFQSNLIISF